MNLNLWNKCLFSLSLLFEVIGTAADLYMYILPIYFFLLLERKNFNTLALVSLSSDCESECWRAGHAPCAGSARQGTYVMVSSAASRCKQSPGK